MNRASFVLYLAVVAGITSCTPSTDSETSLIGNWSVRESLGPGYYTTQLTFAGDGTFTDAVRNFGSYPGQSKDDLSSYTIMSGTYKVEGDQLQTNITHIAVWDRFYGANSPETVQTVNTTVFDQTHFRIVGPMLTLDYVSYPADAPVPTTMTFVRVE
jgi:hypothetical protein